MTANEEWANLACNVRSGRGEAACPRGDRWQLRECELQSRECYCAGGVAFADNGGQDAPVHSNRRRSHHGGLQIGDCTTTLLFPFVTNQARSSIPEWSISNTSAGNRFLHHRPTAAANAPDDLHDQSKPLLEGRS